MFCFGDFDGGNIRCLDASDPANIRLEIKPDGKADFYQWFYFRLVGAKGQPCVLNIENAGGASYTPGWRNYRAVASYDRNDWTRIDTGYEDGVLSMRLTPETNSVYIAYFAPYPIERHADFIAEILASPLADLVPIGETLDGRNIDLLQVGEPSANKRKLWVIARQHPGETMAEWWMEGFLNRLTDAGEETAQKLLENAVFYVVPNMNLDGSARGHLRTNASGTDLNREWSEPSMEKSPEVFLVRSKMAETGVDFFFDVHGDEAIPNNFLDGAIGIPKWNDRHQNLLSGFSDALLAASEDFQTKVGYPPAAPGKANLKIATNYMAEAFDCLAMTLEMPFKDADVNPDQRTGWSPQRCRQLGRASLEAMAAMAGQLRD